MVNTLLILLTLRTHGAVPETFLCSMGRPSQQGMSKIDLTELASSDDGTTDSRPF